MRRGSLLVLAALLGGVLIAGAQARVLLPDKASAVKKTTVTLTGWASSPAETAALRTTIRGFERSHPSYTVNYAPINGDYPAAMLAKFAARRPPDVFYVDSNVAPDWMSQGVLEPLDSYIKKSKYNIKPFFPRLVSAFKYKGHIYGLPKDWSPLAMETNNAMMAKAGVKPPKTWAQLRTVAQKLKDANAVPGGAPLCIDPDWARLLAFVYQNKGSFLNSAKTKATVNTGAVRDAVNFYVGLLKDGLAKTPGQLGVDWCGEALGKQKAGIIFEGNWLLPYMTDNFPGTAYKTYVLPKGKTRGNLGFTVSYSMSRFSANKPAAWTLLSFLTGKQGMKIWTSKGLALPARSDVKPVAGRATLLKQAGYSHAWQFAPGFSKVMDDAGSALQAVINGDKSVSQMLAEIQAEANQALGSG